MRRTALIAALTAVVAPVPALAAGPASAGRGSEAQVREIPSTSAGVACSLIPVPAVGEPTPVGSGPCPGVRPGGRVVTRIGDCTLNFLFRAPDGTRYIGTAGHCVDPGQDYTFKDTDPDGRGHIEKVWARGHGPAALDPAHRRFGEFAYTIVSDPKDFALIRLDSGVVASPEMCHFGAPRGVSAATAATEPMGPVVLRYYGNAEGVGDVAPARSAVALGTPDPDHIYAVGLALPGDSGAGVMTADGLAIGVLVTFGYQIPGLPTPPGLPVPFLPGPAATAGATRAAGEVPHADDKGVDVGTMGITRLAPQLARAAEKLGVALELVTAG